jgi:hypothetical protein
VGQFSAFELHRQFDFVPFIEEPPDHLGFGLHVMVVNLGTEAHFFDDDLLLALAGVAVFLGLLVPELAVVHHLADRGHFVGGNLNQVQPALPRQCYSVAGKHQRVLSTFTYEADFTRPDAFVYTKISTDIFSPLSSGQ